MRRSPVHPLLTTILLVLSIPPIQQLWAIWFAFIPLFLLIYMRPRPILDALYAFLIFAVWWSITGYAVIAAYGWRMFLMIIGGSGCVAAVIIGLSSLGVHYCQKREAPSIVHIILPVGIWLTVISILGNTDLGYMPFELYFYQPLPLLQVARIGGLHFLIALILLWNISIAYYIAYKDRTAKRMAMCSLVLTGIIFVWGLSLIHQEKPDAQKVKVALVQSNFPMSMEWRNDNQKYIFERYGDWADRAKKESVDMIIYPEYNLSRVLSYEDTIKFYSTLAKRSGAYLFAGTYTDEKTNAKGERGKYNVGLGFDSEGNLLGAQKSAANLPFRKIGQLFDGDFIEMNTPFGSPGILLCYDDSVRWVANKWMKNGADFLIVLTNPSTFAGPSIRGFQMHQDQLRAIESNKELIRVSANGISGIIDRFGKLRSASRYDHEELIIASLLLNTR